MRMLEEEYQSASVPGIVLRTESQQDGRTAAVASLPDQVSVQQRYTL